MTDFTYIGSELDVFAFASNWKSYYKGLIAEYIGRNVLEVGAGIGATTQTLCDGSQERWICLEPDPKLADQIKTKIDSGELPKCCTARNGTVAEMSGSDKFDSILYIDVLEHIEADREELESAARLLKNEGHLIVLSPAHQGLYTPFDAKIGHFRRYTKATLSSAVPANLKLVKLIYVDSFGALASAANRYILKSDAPTKKQILFWDTKIIPFSRFFDSKLGYALGKSVIGVWKKE
ncbi:MAG: class I SAM-dependent methyltransferase [Saprospiraceae bacterium]|nr:class I SAM-dependent methyltransferase [Pyrinomonadaceae bacterium]